MPECCEKKKVRSEEEKKALQIRLNRIIGQLEGIKKMIDEDRYCDDILTQLAASDKAIKNLSALIFEKHVSSCVVNSIKEGDTSVVDEVITLFKRYI